MMHVLFENISPQLLALWRGKYKNDKDDKGKDVDDSRDFVFDEATWEAIKAEIQASNKLVPSQFAPYVNPIDRKSFWTAETHSYFLMHLGPIILWDRLPRPYYQHFLAISEITKKVVQIEITNDEVDQLERDLLKWVRDFEK
jgi:hypothetical protein